jgi:hypothetical protein
MGVVEEMINQRLTHADAEPVYMIDHVDVAKAASPLL